MNIQDWLADVDEELLTYDGFDEAIEGYAVQMDRPHRVVYDHDKCVEVCMRDGMTHEEACEYIAFNMVHAYIGDRSPIFLIKYEREG